MKVKILDCTLRDGGYYTNWDFSRHIVDRYIKTMNDLPIDYVEIGYRSPAKKNYLGEYFYTPIETINRIREQLDSKIKLAVMINTKDISNVEELEQLLLECRGKIDLIRFAVAPSNINDAILLSKKVKELGFKVALNLMYLSQRDSEEIINEANYILEQIADIDFLYLVDSYGACLPAEVKDKFSKLRQEHMNLATGFHGHDNIQLAYANSLEAINAGVDIIDSTITGMGRGAGNLSTELICTFKAADGYMDFDYTNLVKLVEEFNELKAEHGWGTSLPYIISGFNKLPQGEVMDLISMKRYTTNNIVNVIKNKINNGVQKNTLNEIIGLSNSNINCTDYDFAILVGGGTSVTDHMDGLKTLNEKFNILFIHSTTKHLVYFLYKGFNNLVCLPGDEIKKVEDQVLSNSKLNFVIPSDLTVSGEIKDSNYYSIEKSSIDEMLNSNTFSEDAPLFMSLKVTDILNIKHFFLIGFDGYTVESQTNKILREENQTIIDNYAKFNKKLVSLTPSKYNINLNSLYSLIVHGQNFS